MIYVRAGTACLARSWRPHPPAPLREAWSAWLSPRNPSPSGFWAKLWREPAFAVHNDAVAPAVVFALQRWNDDGGTLVLGEWFTLVPAVSWYSDGSVAR